MKTTASIFSHEGYWIIALAVAVNAYVWTKFIRSRKAKPSN